jgi:hypothetical protein
MNRPALTAVLSVTALSALALGLADRPPPPPPGEDADKAFAALKALEGAWVLADEAGQPTDRVGSVYHVTAGGSALVETMFPGHEHEMVTMYYVEDGQLKMTHYCTMGNRPVLTSTNPTEHEMSFTCDQRDCCSPEMHMHAAVITLIDQDHITTAWTSSDAPAEEHSAVFNLIRQPDAEP